MTDSIAYATVRIPTRDGDQAEVWYDTETNPFHHEWVLLYGVSDKEGRAQALLSADRDGALREALWYLERLHLLPED